MFDRVLNTPLFDTFFFSFSFHSDPFNFIVIYSLIMDDSAVTLHKKFSVKNFFRKCGQIRSFLRNWSHFLNKALMKNYIFYVVDVLWLFWSLVGAKGRLSNMSNQKLIKAENFYYSISIILLSRCVKGAFFRFIERVECKYSSSINHDGA